MLSTPEHAIYLNFIKIHKKEGHLEKFSSQNVPPQKKFHQIQLDTFKKIKCKYQKLISNMYLTDKAKTFTSPCINFLHLYLCYFSTLFLFTYWYRTLPNLPKFSSKNLFRPPIWSIFDMCYQPHQHVKMGGDY